MAIMGVPFKAPAPYPLPEDFVGHLKAQPAAELVRMVSQLVVDNQCADLVFVEQVGADGRVTVTAAAGADPAAQKAAAALLQEADQSAYALADASAAMTSQVLQAKAAQLVMGELTPGDATLPQPALQQFLLNGADNANIGFVYYNPLLTPEGQPLGSLNIFRRIGSGPLNHDQPALVHALILVLGQSLAATPVA